MRRTSKGKQPQSTPIKGCRAGGNDPGLALIQQRGRSVFVVIVVVVTVLVVVLAAAAAATTTTTVAMIEDGSCDVPSSMIDPYRGFGSRRRHANVHQVLLRRASVVVALVVVVVSNTLGQGPSHQGNAISKYALELFLDPRG